MSGDIRKELMRWGVRFTPPRRMNLRSLGFDTHGELSAVTSQEVVRQLGATTDRLFQSDLASAGPHLVQVILTSYLPPVRLIVERNALLMSIGLSVLLPWWDQRAGWLTAGLHTLAQGTTSPVAWPGQFAVHLHQTPGPASAVHLTIRYRGKL